MIHQYGTTLRNAPTCARWKCLLSTIGHKIVGAWFFLDFRLIRFVWKCVFALF